MKYIIKIDDKYLRFTLNYNDFCCGQAIIGDINYQKYNQVQLESSKKEYQLLKNWDAFLNYKLVISNYSDTITSIICTVTDLEILKCLQEIGFKQLSEFINCKTGNTVYNLEYIVDHGYSIDDEEDEEDEEYDDDY